MRTGILILFPEANKTQDDNREVVPGEKLLSCHSEEHRVRGEDSHTKVSIPDCNK